MLRGNDARRGRSDQLPLPPHGEFKLNVNGTNFREEGCVGWGAVTRGFAGHVLAAISHNFHICYDSDKNLRPRFCLV